MPSAAILSIGDELILGQILDTNCQWLSDQLVQHGIMPIERRTVEDDRTKLTTAISQLARYVDVLILTGGLGPTADDVTRQALGDVVDPGQPLVTDDAALDRLHTWFAGRDREMPPQNALQAMHPPSMQLIENTQGTAPGLVGQYEHCHLFALPGPPREMQAMFQQHVVPLITSQLQLQPIHTTSVHMFGLGESDAAQRLGDLMDRQREILVGTTASQGIVTARIRSTSHSAADESAVNQVAQTVENHWQPYAYSRGDQTLASVVGDLLRERKASLATAESCTGGWLGKMIVDTPGSSEYYLGGWVAYSNEMKTQLLNVSPHTIETSGAVSAPVAQAMAVGALQQTNCTLALSITGIAGPEDSQYKKAGTVFIGVAQQGADQQIHAKVCKFVFPRGRSLVRDRAAKAALQLARFTLLGIDLETCPMLWQVELDSDTQ